MSNRIDLKDEKKSGKYQPLQFDAAADQLGQERSFVLCWCWLVSTILCILIVYWLMNSIRNTVDP